MKPPHPSLANAHPEDWYAALRREFIHGRPWIDRAVVLSYAVITGGLVVCFTLLAEHAISLFHSLRTWGPYGPWLALLWTPFLCIAVVYATRRYLPLAAGSGIPQVLRALEEESTPSQARALVSVPLGLGKIALVSTGLLAGLSIGREGPTVQVGAGIMAHAKRWLSPESGIDTHDLMVAGAAAGIAAAFNTPLGGIVFALEQLTRRRHLSHSTLVIAVIVLAGLVAVTAFGNETYFGRLRVQAMGWHLLLPGLAVALLSGLAGGLFARLLLASARPQPGWLGRWRQRHPLYFVGACGLLVALIGLVSSGETAGAGYLPTRAMLEGQTTTPTGIYTLLKLCATWLSSWSGVPAGVFAPSLAIGAGIGHDIAVLSRLDAQAAIPLIALGMVGFLAASTQEPITAFIIVMEMVAGHAMVLSLMACALLASGVSRLISPPLYSQLATLLVLPSASASEEEARRSALPRP